MSNGNRALICALYAMVFLTLLAGLETCSGAMVTTAQIRAETQIAVAKERTERAEGRHETLRCLLRRASCEDRP